MHLVYSLKFELSFTFVIVTGLTTVPFGENNQTSCALYFSNSTLWKNSLLYWLFITRCQCGNCQAMEREEESICCQEVDAVRKKNLEDVMEEQLQAELRCIVQHPGFEAVCLNVWVLQTAWLQYKQQYGSSAYEGPEHKKNCHIAYRQLVSWCWGTLGKNIRIPLPSCAVNCIRAYFPEPNQLEEDMVFTGFTYADE